jgi:hypothetical protein
MMLRILWEACTQMALIGLKNAFSREWVQQLHEGIVVGGTGFRSSGRGAINAERHDLQVTKSFFETLPQSLKDLMTY